MNILKLSSACLLAVLLSACHFSNDDHDVEVTNGLTTLGEISADGDPVEIYDPESLKQDIASLFGNADDDPLAVECGNTDTLQSVIDRGGRA
ncbi:hypothetical protein [Leucothrix arctica]|uniref:Uncharacterized protein n=1 Tax=Leucothrix arctica TaxID=1481894 RepID=A0A317CC59_9GAMM|nr:hypothetical protein [Leucothrix arctica]PWQ95691.1 hypothetical protein DKT75_11700 [Leucothrix arctica]